MPDNDRKEQISEAIQRELESALRDVGVLLEFLGKAADQKLQAQFDDTRGNKNLSISPPSKAYSEFLNRLSLIRTSYQQTGDIDGKTPHGDFDLTDRAFILWAQDFLAALAAPATVNSIQLTSSFLNHRFHRSKSPLAKAPLGFADDRFATYATDLVRKINRQYWITLIVTILTVLISIYALGGHQIIDQQKTAIAELTGINDKISDLESHLTNPHIVNRSAIKYLKTVEHLEEIYSNADATDPPTPVSASVPISTGPSASARSQFVRNKQDAEPLGKLYLCDNIDVINDENGPKVERPSFGPIPNHSFYYYGSYDGIDICRQRRRAMIHLFSIGEQLMTWQRIATYPLALLTTWFNVPNELSSSPALCESYAGIPSDHQDVIRCARSLSEISEYYGVIPDSILGCISMYIMPCLYGFLGASVATFRYLRQRVDKSYLNFTDRSVFIQNGILGVIAGIVVGLFVSSFNAGAGTAAALGLSAIAFLAGYNVSGLFAFFDEISARIFQTENQTSK